MTFAVERKGGKDEDEGEAEAVRIQAEAQAEANEMIAESLTPELIEQQKITKWNGDVPRVYGGDSLSILPIDDEKKAGEE